MRSLRGGQPPSWVPGHANGGETSPFVASIQSDAPIFDTSSTEVGEEGTRLTESQHSSGR